MGKAKDIVLKPITAKEANALVRRVHYSGKVAHNSQLHIGVYYNGNLEGALQFGPSLDKRKIQGLVTNTGWNDFIELNRMALTDVLPRNSESRALAVSMRVLKKHAPHIKWVVTFADGAQCGDGTIYRAAGFILTNISVVKNLARKDNGEVVHKMTFEISPISTGYADINHGKNNWGGFCKIKGWELLAGYNLRYIYFIDKSYRERLTVPELPYSEIERMGAGMYKGIPRGEGETDNAPNSNSGTEGASPISPLL